MKRCFKCSRPLSNLARFSIVLPLQNLSTPGGYVCEKCIASVGKEIRLYPLGMGQETRGLALADSPDEMCPG